MAAVWRAGTIWIRPASPIRTAMTRAAEPARRAAPLGGDRLAGRLGPLRVADPGKLHAEPGPPAPPERRRQRDDEERSGDEAEPGRPERHERPASRQQQHEWIPPATTQGERDEDQGRERDPQRGEPDVIEARRLPFGDVGQEGVADVAVDRQAEDAHPVRVEDEGHQGDGGADDERPDRAARPRPPAHPDRDRHDEGQHAGDERQRAAPVQVDPQDRDDRHDRERPDPAVPQPRAPGRRAGQDEHDVPDLRPRGPDRQPDDDPEAHQHRSREWWDAGRRQPDEVPGQRDGGGGQRDREQARPHQPAGAVGEGEQDVPRPAVGDERLAGGQPAEGVGPRHGARGEDHLAHRPMPAEVRVDLRTPGDDPGTDQDDRGESPSEEAIVGEQRAEASHDVASSVGRHLARW